MTDVPHIGFLGQVRRLVPEYVGLIVVVFIGLALRIGVAFATNLPWFTTDSYVYISMADAIRAGEPVAGFPNGYPLLVALVGALFAEPSFPAAMIWLQVALSTGTVVLTYFLARAVVPGRMTPLLAAICIACWPNQLNYTRSLLSEVPATFLLTLGLWGLVRGLTCRAGICLQIASTFRSTLLPVGPIIALLSFRRKVDRRTIVRLVLGLFIVFIAHTGLLLAGVVKSPSNLGDNLLRAVRPEMVSMQATLDSYSVEQRAQPLRTYVTFAVDNPGEFAEQRLQSFRELWGPWPRKYEYGANGAKVPRSFANRLMIGLRAPLLILALLGLFWSRRPTVPLGVGDAWSLIVPALVVTIIHVGFFSAHRFTFPAEPALAVLAATAVARILGVDPVTAASR
jgi:hypothetical protein